MNTSPLRPTPAARPRYGALALLLGGPLSLVFHALWRIGHGPTVVNEHGVVLGLTNDQWSYLGAAWMAPVALGVLIICALHQGTLPQMTATLVVAGLALGAVSAWIWPLYSLGALLQYGGMACLTVLIARDRRLPRWSATPLVVAIATFVLLVIAPEHLPSVDTIVHLGRLQGTDLVAASAAAGWTTLGIALARAHPQSWPSRRSWAPSMIPS